MSDHQRLPICCFTRQILDIMHDCHYCCQQSQCYQYSMAMLYMVLQEIEVDDKKNCVLTLLEYSILVDATTSKYV